MERLYIDNAHRMEKHYIRGSQQLRLLPGLVTAVAMTRGHLRAERRNLLRSLVGTVELHDRPPGLLRNRNLSPPFGPRTIRFAPGLRGGGGKDSVFAL